MANEKSCGDAATAVGACAGVTGKQHSSHLENQNGGPPEGRIAPLTLGVGGMGAKRPMVTLGEPMSTLLDAQGAEYPRLASGMAAAGAGAKRPLDLSLGHIGTSSGESPGEVEVHDFGPFRLVFDLTSRVGKVHVDRSAFTSRQELRSAQRQFLKVATRIGQETGFVIQGGAV